MGASDLLSLQQQQQNPHDPGLEPVPSAPPSCHTSPAVGSASLWLLCQNKHIWEMCQSWCKATAETSAKVPATTVVAFACMLVPLSQSAPFSCHKLELIWLSFREIRNNSNCVSMLKSKSLSGWLHRAFFGAFCFISWRSTDTAPSWAELVCSNSWLSGKCSASQWWRALLLLEGKLIWSADPSVP